MTISYWRLLLLFGVGFLIFTGLAVSPVQSSDTAMQQAPLVFSPAFSINPASINFGSVPVGLSRTDSMVISNTGDAPLIIQTISSSNAAFHIQSPEFLNAVQFDGVNDYVSFGTSGFPIGTAPRTLELWLKTAGTTDYREMFSYGVGNTGQSFTVGTHGSEVFVSSWANPQYTVEAGLNNGVWHHLAVSYDGTTSTIYFDGSLLDSRTLVMNTGTGATGYIGCRIYPDEYFNGTLDEVRLWNYARTLDEIRTTMFTTVAVNEPGLVSYWRLDEGVGSVTADVSGNGHTGTLTNGPIWVSSGVKMSVAPSASIKVIATFVPTNTIPQSGNIVFTHNAPGSPGIVAASGTGYSPHIITATAGPHGSIVPSGPVMVDNGTNKTFSIRSDQNYRIDSVIVDGAMMGTDTSYTFVNVTTDHTIRAVFTALTPLFVLTVDTLRFGDLYLSQLKSETLWVHNVGIGTLAVDSIRSSDTHFTVNPLNGNIDAGESLRVAITFSPVTHALHSADILFFHSGPSSPRSLFVIGGGFRPPVVNTISPTIAGAGSTVSITGSYFGATPAKNTVYFGGKRASVLSASSNVLSVTVPIGAGFAPVAVTSESLTAYSTNKFLLVQPTVGVIDSTTFAPALPFSVGSNPWEVVLADFDGDGKADLLTVNQTPSTVSVLRNIGSPGSPSFAPQVQFAAGLQPLSTATADFDGDGRLDIVAGSFSTHSVIVLRNVCTPGSITSSSFETGLEIAAGTYPYAVAVGDFDGDGRPDIVAADWGADSVSVLRNTTFGTNISFAPPVHFSVGEKPYYLAVGDIDGDGRPDIVTADHVSSTISVLRNVTQPLTINSSSFVNALTMNANGNPDGIVLADFDGDGKLDMAMADFFGSAGQTVSVRRNMSTPGNIVFGFAVFWAGHAPRRVAVGDFDGDGKPDLAVTSYADSAVSVLRNLSTPGTISFAYKVDFFSGNRAFAVTAGDVDGDGFTDLVVANQASAQAVVLRHNTVIRSVSVHIDLGWNLVSVSLGMDDYRTTTIFPTASSRAFRYLNGYQSTDTLSNSEGYWLKFASTQNLTITGQPISADTFSVAPGWNLLGSISSPVPTASVIPLGTTILSSFFQFHGSYLPADTLKPAVGYWVKVSNAGGLVVSAPSGLPPSFPASSRSK